MSYPCSLWRPATDKTWDTEKDQDTREIRQGATAGTGTHPRKGLLGGAEQRPGGAGRGVEDTWAHPNDELCAEWQGWDIHPPQCTEAEGTLGRETEDARVISRKLWERGQELMFESEKNRH